ncbi:MAG: RsmB/NOP family class I SAM-dependent RNA methyltransferase [Pseudomonadota bacterium]|nr:RsmB/NOP family class I SAM-dependent RNA methyltransferase [Pseudomonadota bacterium]MDE3038280.1 RsmB/NOP family class I SAM-dependent RNA methyltransferase [Pseudomonadota bacterium]
MTPGARIQASIELLDQIFRSWDSEKRFPADKLIDQYFKARKFIGSKDRAYTGELVYWCLRHKASLEWWIAKLEGDVHARAVVLTALMLRKDFTVAELDAISQDSKYALAKLTPLEKQRCEELYRHPREGGDPFANKDNQRRIDSRLRGSDEAEIPDPVRLNYPEWMDAILRESFGAEFERAMQALNAQASTDLRVNTLKTTREALRDALYKEGFETELTTLSPIGLRLKKRAPIFTSPLFKAGHFEVQDEGSQLVALLVDAQPGMKVIDFCAGAGGKTLALAAAMKNKGRILAWDTSEKRLAQMSQRLKRAGVDNAQSHVITSEQDAFIKRHKASADRVLVDAPCSGSGTWRRNPDLKWRFSARDLREVITVQQSILQSAARLVKPGGRIVYATCSVLTEENENQIAQFLKNGNNFRVVCAKKIWDKERTAGETERKNSVSYLRVTPHQDGVDGFFAAVLERRLDRVDINSNQT